MSYEERDKDFQKKIEELQLKIKNTSHKVIELDSDHDLLTSQTEIKQLKPQDDFDFSKKPCSEENNANALKEEQKSEGAEKQQEPEGGPTPENPG